MKSLPRESARQPRRVTSTAIFDLTMRPFIFFIFLTTCVHGEALGESPLNRR